MAVRGQEAPHFSRAGYFCGLLCPERLPSNPGGMARRIDPIPQNEGLPRIPMQDTRCSPEHAEPRCYILVAADVHSALRSKPSAYDVASHCLEQKVWGL